MPEASPLDALRHAAEALRQQARSFALVGGLAVSVRAEVRFTRDIDLAVAVDDDADAERLVCGLGARGYVVTATVEHATLRRLATVRLRGPMGVVCDLLFASSGIEREIARAATALDLAHGLVVPVARVEELLATKVLSATPRRPQDELDIAKLVEFNPRFDEAAVWANLELIAGRGFARGQDLREKLEALLARARAVQGA